jgi:NADPH-dependent glutamate synthase beta subunit-like oxidoreductase
MQLGFYYNQSRCIGCHNCIAACRSSHGLGPRQPDMINLLSWEKGEFPKVSLVHQVSLCFHCAEPRCVWVCPAEALIKNEEGVVIADIRKCRVSGRCGIIDEEAMGPTYHFGEVEAPCQMTCPAHISIPGYVSLIAKHKFKEALDLIRERMPLPSVCGRVCLAPCETECRRNSVEQAIAIEALKRFVTDYVVDEIPSPLRRTKIEKVAIIGSGPAGLAAAYDLIRKGYGVNIYEASPMIGGWLVLGIPEYRLPKAILKRDIDYIRALGVEMKVNTPLGQGLTLDDLASQGYGAILLAIGAQQGQRLKIAGADLEGALVATTFLRDLNLGRKVQVGNSVIVIGGGSVAVDCARSALRLGAADVHLACLECREDMPAAASELAEAEEEGIIIHPSLTITQVMGKEGKVTGVECFRLSGVEFDEDGRVHVDIIKGTEHILPADTVIFAVGQSPLIPNTIKSGIKITKRGTIFVDSETLTTTRPGVFAAGDAVRGPSNVIQAIADGQKAALYIDCYLQKTIPKEDEVGLSASDIKIKIPADMKKQERQALPCLPIPERAGNFAEVALGFSPEMAVAEAKRCLNCAGHLCKDVCPYHVPQFVTNDNSHIVKCDLCILRLNQSRAPACVASCPTEALNAGPMEELMAKYGDLKELQEFADYRKTTPKSF